MGDEVIAYRAPGAYAAELLVPAQAQVPRPAGLDWPQAAGLMLTGATAWHALTVTDVRKGDTVLVHGGAGGVGVMAIQLAADRGARVLATAGTAVRAAGTAVRAAGRAVRGAVRGGGARCEGGPIGGDGAAGARSVTIAGSPAGWTWVSRPRRAPGRRAPRRGSWWWEGNSPAHRPLTGLKARFVRPVANASPQPGRAGAEAVFH